MNEFMVILNFSDFFLLLVLKSLQLAFDKKFCIHYSHGKMALVGWHLKHRAQIFHETPRTSVNQNCRENCLSKIKFP